MRLAYIVAGILFVVGPVACGSSSNLAGGKGGSGGTSSDAAAGASGGGPGGTGGNAGAGGASDAATDGTPTSCPATRPTTGATCTFVGNCNYNDMCNCHGCCYSGYACANGAVTYLGNNDGCLQGSPCPADGGSDGAAAVCTPGADQTCNENPAISSIHGHCTDAGVCVCSNDAAANPASGRCP